MEKTISATEAVRKFSEILNSIKYKGESYTIVRGGKKVASICPVEIHLKERSLGELKTLFENIPKLGDETESFERDLREILEHQPAIPKEDRWA
ncbi:MAG: antitoxin [Thermodesulfobacteriota bacterium]|nr:antitoxin [Thermodesulfobacteriota bacterium]